MNKRPPWFLLFLLLMPACSSTSYLQTSDGVRLAYAYTPVLESRGTAVLIHGLGSDLNEWYTFKKYLHERGWSVLTFDLRGHGLSTQWNGEELNWRDFTEDGHQTVLRDVEAAVSSLQRQDRRNLWLIGSSFGANLAINYAAEAKQVDGLVLLTPGFNYAGLTAREALESLVDVPVLILAASDDPGAVETAHELYEAAREPKKILTFAQGGHGSAIFDFVKQAREEAYQWMTHHSAAVRPNNTNG